MNSKWKEKKTKIYDNGSSSEQVVKFSGNARLDISRNRERRHISRKDDSDDDAADLYSEVGKICLRVNILAMTEAIYFENFYFTLSLCEYLR